MLKNEKGLRLKFSKICWITSLCAVLGTTGATKTNKKPKATATTTKMDTNLPALKECRRNLEGNMRQGCYICKIR